MQLLTWINPLWSLENLETHQVLWLQDESEGGCLAIHGLWGKFTGNPRIWEEAGWWLMGMPLPRSLPRSLPRPLPQLWNKSWFDITPRPSPKTAWKSDHTKHHQPIRPIANSRNMFQNMVKWMLGKWTPHTTIWYYYYYCFCYYYYYLHCKKPVLFPHKVKPNRVHLTSEGCSARCGIWSRRSWFNGLSWRLESESLHLGTKAECGVSITLIYIYIYHER